jgi:hypothetical protein
MVESITGHPDVAQQLVAVLTGDTPQVVWDAVINMRAELPPELAAMVGERARAVGRTAEADALA